MPNQAIARAAEACPEATIILGHMGGYFHVEEAIDAAERHPNLVLETSAIADDGSAPDYAFLRLKSKVPRPIKTISHQGLADGTRVTVVGMNTTWVLQVREPWKN